MTRLVLGSASSGRRKVLRGAGIEPLVIVSGIDEDAIIASLDGAAPEEIVGTLAAAKADDVVSKLPDDVAADCLVIGCDSMLFVDGALRGKPGSKPAARAQWQTMAGRSGVLYSGHCVLRLVNHTVTHHEHETGCTTVYFGTPTVDELDAYVDSGEPVGVAGAFTLDGLGGWFIDGIEGDAANVIGISLPLIRRLIARCGVSVTTLWTGADAAP
jgi:septum formation protein